MDKKEKTMMWSLLFLYSITGKMADEKVRRCVKRNQLDPNNETNGSSGTSSRGEDERRELYGEDE